MESSSPYQWLWNEIAIRFGDQAADELKQGFTERGCVKQREKRASLPKKCTSRSQQDGIPDGMRRCTVCRQILALSEFHSRGGGHKDYRCRVCAIVKKYGRQPLWRGRGMRKEYYESDQRQSTRAKLNAITLLEAESMSLDEWAELPKKVQDRLFAEYNRE